MSQLSLQTFKYIVIFMYLSYQAIWMHVNVCMYKMLTSKKIFRNSKQRLFWLHTIILMIGKSLNYEYTFCMYTTHTYADTYHTITHNSMYKMSTSKIQFRNSKQRLFWLHTIILMIGKSLKYKYTCCMYATRVYVVMHNTCMHNSMYKMLTSKIQSTLLLCLIHQLSHFLCIYLNSSSTSICI
jgi:hypothetical protein